MIDTEMYKIRLGKELSLVEDELKEVGKKDPDTGEWEAVETEIDSDHADDNDVASNLESYEENGGIIEALRTRYTNITTALQKIEKGTYGICEIGGEEISEERLNANPSARTCVAHAK